MNGWKTKGLLEWKSPPHKKLHFTTKTSQAIWQSQQIQWFQSNVTAQLGMVDDGGQREGKLD